MDASYFYKNMKNMYLWKIIRFDILEVGLLFERAE